MICAIRFPREIKTVVELKMTRQSMPDKQLGDEIVIALSL
jgi:hypothetical protein